MSKRIASNKAKGTGRKPKPLTPNDNTTTLAIRCYDEQCLCGSLEETLSRIVKMNRNRYEIYAIVHSKTEKKHAHIAIKYRGKKPTDSIRVSRILKEIGICFREEDAVIMFNRGLETLGSWTGYFVYLCHKDAASESAGKAQYEISDFVTNLEPVVFRNMMQNRLPKRKITPKERFSLDCDEAKQAGYDLWNKGRWFYNKRKDYVEYDGKRLALIKEFFDEGRKEKISNRIPQIIIVINVSENKVFDVEDIMSISRMALTDMDMTVDRTEDKDAQDGFVEYLNDDLLVGVPADVPPTKFPFMIALNDEWFVLHNRVLTDDRNTSLEAWTYRIFIVNKADSYFREYEEKTFYYCTINEDTKELKFEAPCELGDIEEQTERKQLYINFRDAFNYRIKNYAKPEINTAVAPATIDYSDLL